MVPTGSKMEPSMQPMALPYHGHQTYVIQLVKKLPLTWSKLQFVEIIVFAKKKYARNKQWNSYEMESKTTDVGQESQASALVRWVVDVPRYGALSRLRTGLY